MIETLLSITKKVEKIKEEVKYVSDKQKNIDKIFMMIRKMKELDSYSYFNNIKAKSITNIMKRDIDSCLTLWELNEASLRKDLQKLLKR